MVTRNDIDILDDDLKKACAEILHWRRTGMYRGSALRRLADERFTEFGDDAMRQAEDFVLLRAAEVLCGGDAVTEDVA